MEAHTIQELVPRPSSQCLGYLVSVNAFPLNEVSTSENGYTQSSESWMTSIAIFLPFAKLIHLSLGKLVPFSWVKLKSWYQSLQDEGREMGPFPRILGYNFYITVSLPRGGFVWHILFYFFSYVFRDRHENLCALYYFFQIFPLFKRGRWILGTSFMAEQL